MNQDEIIAMAREAGFRTGHIDLTIGDPVPFIAPASGTSCIVDVQRFAALVAAKEREACAQVAEDEDHEVSVRGYYAQLGDARATMRNIAAAIRARGTKEGV